MNVVSKLPDGSDWQWSRNWCDWRWISAHNRDDLIPVHLQPRVETNYDVVGEHSLGVLFGSASLQGQLDFVAQLAFADDLAGTVTIKVRVGDSVKLFVEFHIHLCEKRNVSVTFLRKKNFKSVELLFHPRRQTHANVCRVFM